LKEVRKRVNEEPGQIKVVIFTDGPDDDCEDEKWRRFQITLPETCYKTIKNFLWNLYGSTKEMDDP